MKHRAPYTKPKVIAVKLNPDQAVLSACSASATTIRDVGGTGGCSPRSSHNCRSRAAGHASEYDSAVTS